MNASDSHVEHILRGQKGPQTAAFFDFDGTLVDGQSITAFLSVVLPNLPTVLAQRLQVPGISSAGLLREWFETGLPLFQRLMPAWLRGPESGEDIEAVYRMALQLCAGRREQELRLLGEQVFAETLAGRLRADLWAQVQAHQRRGHTVVLVSAATPYQLLPMARALGIDHVLCTQMEVVDGVVTGRLAGPPLNGRAKAVAVQEFGDAHGITLASSYAYADSVDDVPFLASVGNPCVVGSGTELVAEATARGWDVLRPDPESPSAALTAVRSAAAYGGLLAGVSTGLFVGLLGADGRRAAELGVMLASDTYLGLAGVRLRVTGAAHLRSRWPAVFLFNHQSPLDVAIMIKLLGQDYTGFAKAELAAAPGLAQLGRLMDVMFIDRGARRLAPDFLVPALDCLARGLSLVVAPEGTRSRTPMPGPFKKGGFLIARKAGVPVVPIVIRNAGRLMARNGWTVRSGLIDVVVHEPIDVGTWKLRELETRIEEVRQFYLDTLIGVPTSGPENR
ncbi:HAD-IB family hydrolase [Nocardia sp. NPDC088792]|uniref:HAD-IB family hydrolase n=1 Tax=Nocardia sp. NPDC088792 TaxID=3364332 RepID=UPI0038071773